MIKPYYQDEYVTIYCDDFRNAEWLISDKAILITDPPYGINLDISWTYHYDLARGHSPTKAIEKLAGDEGTLDLSFLFQFSRRLIWGFPYIYDSEATGWLVWDKQPGVDNFKGAMTPVEMASTTLWRGFGVVRAMWGGFLRDNQEQRFEHPTQKPLKVFLEPIARYTEPNDIIIDLFLGSGSCAVAAKKLNRKFIGYEIEEKYCDIAANRCRQMVFNFGDTPQRDGSAEPEFYQFLLDNKDNPEFMKGVQL